VFSVALSLGFDGVTTDDWRLPTVPSLPVAVSDYPLPAAYAAGVFGLSSPLKGAIIRPAEKRTFRNGTLTI